MGRSGITVKMSALQHFFYHRVCVWMQWDGLWQRNEHLEPSGTTSHLQYSPSEGGYEVWCKTFGMVAALSLLSVGVTFLEKSLKMRFQAGYKTEDLLPYNLHWVSSKRCCFYLSHDANRMLLSVYFVETVKSKTLTDGLTNRFPVFQSVRPWF